MKDQLLSELLDRAKAVLFDFDGPICSVFAGLPAPTVAREIREQLAARGIKLTLQGTQADDPMKVLRATTAFGPDIVRAAEDQLNCRGAGGSERIADRRCARQHPSSCRPGNPPGHRQ